MEDIIMISSECSLGFWQKDTHTWSDQGVGGGGIQDICMQEQMLGKSLGVLVCSVTPW